MSDSIPLELQEEIMKRLSVRSLMQFRSVSKAWKSLIDSPGFVACYSRQQKTQMQQYVLVMYTIEYRTQCHSIVDDNSFPENRPFFLTPPHYFLFQHYDIVGGSHGLVCFYAVRDWAVEGKVCLWNPSIKRAVNVVVPNVADGDVYETVLGFGICPETNDSKIVKITYIGPYTKLEHVNSIPSQVEVFALSIGAWRSLHNNLPRKSIRFEYASASYSVDIDGIIYWLAKDRVNVDGGRRGLIVSFNTTSEDFGEVNLPDRLARSPHDLYMSKLRENVAVLEDVEEGYNVWMMEGGLFTKQYTYNVDKPDLASVKCFSHRGDLILEFSDDDQHDELVFCEQQSNNFGYLGFDGVESAFLVHPYTETLFLHDQPHLTIDTEEDYWV